MLCAWGSSVRDHFIPYALKDGEPIHISEGDSGLACNCICPSCHERLVAKKGGIRVHHFAHQSGESCPGVLESSLHIAAKDILAKEKRITLPSVHIQFNSDGPSLQRAGPKTYRVDSVREEKKIGNIKPDLILTIAQRELIVEIFVTHKVDSQKIQKIRELGMSAIEINLRTAPRYITKEALTELIVDGVDNKKWLNNERVNIERKELMSKTVRKAVFRSEPLLLTEKCPKKMRKKVRQRDRQLRQLHGDYATTAYLLDCLRCGYCVDIEPETDSIRKMTHIHCIGHLQDRFRDYETDT